MAIELDGSSEYLTRVVGTPVTSPPISMAAWIHFDSLGTGYTVMNLGHGTTANISFRLNKASNDTVQAFATNSGGTSGTATTSTTASAGAWQHLCAVFAATNSRAAYLNGGGKGTSSASINAGTPNRALIGARMSGGAISAYLAGRVAEAAIWSVALTDEDVAVLALGYSPLLVRPESLVTYVPLNGQYEIASGVGIDLKTGVDWSVVGSPSAYEHPRMIYPGRMPILPFQAAAAGLAHPVFDPSVFGARALRVA